MAKEKEKIAGEIESQEKKEKGKEEKKKRSQKERPKSKKKHTKIQVWKLYKIQPDGLKRLRAQCPRCGPGTFLAVYKNRKYCGRCGWGLIQQEEISK
jgi:ribosomal protein S27AE